MSVGWVPATAKAPPAGVTVACKGNSGVNAVLRMDKDRVVLGRRQEDDDEDDGRR